MDRSMFKIIRVLSASWSTTEYNMRMSWYLQMLTACNIPFRSSIRCQSTIRHGSETWKAFECKKSFAVIWCPCRHLDGTWIVTCAVFLCVQICADSVSGIVQTPGSVVFPIDGMRLVFIPSGIANGMVCGCSIQTKLFQVESAGNLTWNTTMETMNIRGHCDSCRLPWDRYMQTQYLSHAF